MQEIRKIRHEMWRTRQVVRRGQTFLCVNAEERTRQCAAEVFDELEQVSFVEAFEVVGTRRESGTQNHGSQIRDRRLPKIASIASDCEIAELPDFKNQATRLFYF